MLHAKPHTNGNSREDFIDAHRALMAAQKAIKEASSKLFSDVLNGRNYQHLPRDLASDCEIIDRRRAENDLRHAAALIDQIAASIVKVCREDLS